jgi:hypothetical protein
MVRLGLELKFLIACFNRLWEVNLEIRPGGHSHDLPPVEQLLGAALEEDGPALEDDGAAEELLEAAVEDPVLVGGTVVLVGGTVVLVGG